MNRQRIRRAVLVVETETPGSDGTSAFLVALGPGAIADLVYESAFTYNMAGRQVPLGRPQRATARIVGEGYVEKFADAAWLFNQWQGPPAPDQPALPRAPLQLEDPHA